MSKQYGVRDGWNGVVAIVDTLEEAEVVYESLKEEKLLSDDIDFVSIVEIERIENFSSEVEIKRAVVVQESISEKIDSADNNTVEVLEGEVI